RIGLLFRRAPQTARDDVVIAPIGNRAARGAGARRGLAARTVLLALAVGPEVAGARAFVGRVLTIGGRDTRIRAAGTFLAGGILSFLRSGCAGLGVARVPLAGHGLLFLFQCFIESAERLVESAVEGRPALVGCLCRPGGSGSRCATRSRWHRRRSGAGYSNAGRSHASPARCTSGGRQARCPTPGALRAVFSPGALLGRR